MALRVYVYSGEIKKDDDERETLMLLQDGRDKAIARVEKIRRETQKQGTLDTFSRVVIILQILLEAKTCQTGAFADITYGKYHCEGGNSIRNCCTHNFGTNFKTSVSGIGRILFLQ